MAGETKVQINFDHHIKGRELGFILIEGLKHIIYHREQIPMPFMILEREAKQTEHVRDQSKQKREKHRPIQSLKQRKKKLAIDAITAVVSGLEKCSEKITIYCIALVFGSTIISPKEVFTIIPCFEKPSQNEIVKEEENTTNGFLKRRIDKSGRAMVRHLVTNQCLISMNSIRPTNTFILVLASRLAAEDLLPVFQPKQSQKIPRKGTKCTIILKNTNGDKLHMKETRDFDPNDDEFVRTRDLIWYQAKETIRGFID